MSQRPAPQFEGTVVEIHGIKATVHRHDTADRVRCRPLRDRTQLAVGDVVMVEEARHGPVVVSLGERSRCLMRPQERGRRLMAANVDRVLVVVSVVPPPRAGLIDRFLVASEAAGIDVILVLNKVDLAGVEEARDVLGPYQELGYTVLDVSAATGLGVDGVASLVASGISVFAGHSGVGKSSLLNRLVPQADLSTGVLNAITGKGRHTTTVTTCHEVGGPWPRGALLVDTPGIRAFGLYGLEPVELTAGFRDLAGHARSCRFRDCLHESEPDCGVRAAADAGIVDPTRYAGYLRILASLKAGTG